LVLRIYSLTHQCLAYSSVILFKEDPLQLVPQTI
jgi:hypothetical protein